VGLGNVWRFPYRTYQNGGASFLIPYVIVLVAAGIPMFFLEMAIGQFSSLGSITVWKMVPIMKGIGYAMVVIDFLVSIYYNMILAYTLYYLFASFTSHLPWIDCRPEWTQYGCFDRTVANATIIRNQTMEWCNTLKESNNTGSSDYIGNCTLKPKTPAELYWEREVLDMSEGIGIGNDNMKWDLVLCLLLAWIIVCICLIKGVKSSGKVVYFTAIFPYVVLIILLIWNAQLEGARLGIEYYVIPKWERLRDSKVWYSAGTQIFYSLGISFGGLETMASYNKFNNNIYRDAVLVSMINCGTSIFAGFVIFSVMGFMATKTGLAVDDVVAGGPGLAFIAYPEGISLMPVAPLWAILFFLMLFCLGIDSQFAQVECIVTAITDEFAVFQVGHRKKFFIVGTCIVMFLLGLPQCNRDGIYVFTLFDWYSAGLNVIIVCLTEVIAIAWIYGIWRICDDIKMMIGHRPNYYFIVCWLAVTPLMMTFLFVFSIIDSSRASYGTYVFPDWADGIGWFMFAITMSALAITALVQIFIFRFRNGQPWKDLITPMEGWGPALNENRTGFYSPIVKNPTGAYTNSANSGVPVQGLTFRTKTYDVASVMNEKPPMQDYENPGFDAM
jgi:solute carrier family 6 amino acid transporter-like protein 5/7/9/14